MTAIPMPEHDHEHHDHTHDDRSETLQLWIKALLLIGLGVYFVYNIASGNLTNYVNARFAWLSYVAAALFLLIGAFSVWHLLRDHGTMSTTSMITAHRPRPRADLVARAGDARCAAGARHADPVEAARRGGGVRRHQPDVVGAVGDDRDLQRRRRSSATCSTGCAPSTTAITSSSTGSPPT